VGNPDQGPQAAVTEQADPFRTVRRNAVIAWAVALTIFIVVRGIPLERFIQTVWILLGLFAFNVGRPWRSYARILLDWLPFVGFLWLYDFTRGFADRLGTPTHVTQPLDAEKWLFHGTVPTQWLQQHLHDPPQVHWYGIVVSLVYFSHFVVVWIYAAVLYVRERPRWGRWARRILMLSYAGLVTYIVYPAAPPWFAQARDGLIPGIARISSDGWEALHLHTAAALIQNAQGGANDVAAMPSLHGAFTAMLAVFVWPRLNNVARVLMVLYTLAMAFSLVYSAEHYVVDILMGYAYVGAVLVAAAWWERMRARQRAARAGTPALAPAVQAGR
jgi:PAP2 superfamily